MTGHPEEGYPPAPGTANFDEMRPGCYDPVARLEDMDIDGVWGQLCFPNYARFAGHRFYLNAIDRDLGLACIRTYNDYLLDEWCATDRDRLFGAVVLPLTDVEASVAELRARHRQGRRRPIAFSENPTVLGLPVGAHRPLGSAVRAGRGGRACRSASTSAARRGSSRPRRTRRSGCRSPSSA